MTEREILRLSMAVTIAAAISGEDKPIPTIKRLLEKYETQTGTKRMIEGLEIIAGRRQCLDNLMSNEAVAVAALKISLCNTKLETPDE